MKKELVNWKESSEENIQTSDGEIRQKVMKRKRRKKTQGKNIRSNLYLNEVPERDKKMERSNIWRENGWFFPKVAARQ